MSEDAVSEEYKSRYDNMVDKLVVYYEAQMNSCIDEFGIISSMNTAESEKFKKLVDGCKQASDKLHRVNGNLNSLQPYLHKLDAIEESLAVLEEKVDKLNKFSKQLEVKFQKINLKKS